MVPVESTYALVGKVTAPVVFSIFVPGGSVMAPAGPVGKVTDPVVSSIVVPIGKVSLPGLISPPGGNRISLLVVVVPVGTVMGVVGPFPLAKVSIPASIVVPEATTVGCGSGVDGGMVITPEGPTLVSLGNVICPVVVSIVAPIGSVNGGSKGLPVKKVTTPVVELILVLTGKVIAPGILKTSETVLSNVITPVVGFILVPFGNVTVPLVGPVLRGKFIVPSVAIEVPLGTLVGLGKPTEPSDITLLPAGTIIAFGFPRSVPRCKVILPVLLSMCVPFGKVTGSVMPVSVGNVICPELSISVPLGVLGGGVVSCFGTEILPVSGSTLAPDGKVTPPVSLMSDPTGRTKPLTFGTLMIPFVFT
jgi:hypothetical protein